MELRISCDDGYELDLRVAEMLEKHGFTGIFYIPSFNRELTDEQIIQLSKKHEIGGHTKYHTRLAKIPIEIQEHEVIKGKIEIEDIIGKKIDKFCYPRGWYSDITKKVVRMAGFKEARTMKLGITDITGYDLYELPATAHFRLRDEYKEKGIIVSILDLLEKAGQGGGYFNLVVHSWEIDKFKLWDEFNKLLGQIRKEYESISTGN